MLHDDRLWCLLLDQPERRHLLAQEWPWGHQCQLNNVKSALFYVGYTNPVCVLRADVDYAGNDIGRASATKADDCCDICHKYAGCRAYTWTNQGGGTCWLKSKNGGETYKVGAMSAEAYPCSQPPTPSCSLENDVDYIDNDIGNKPSSTAGGCCDICKNTDKCVAFSWTNQNGGTCWLKSAKGSTAQKAGVISSQVSPNPPGPTCILETDVDFIGNDVGSKASSSAGGCCDICRATTNCVAFSWTNQDGGTCYLKSRTDKKATKSGAISSQVLDNPPAPSCTLEADVDYVGNDIGSKASPTAGGCCDICKNSQGCAAFSWTNQNGGTCWLKSSKGSTTQKPGVISSQVAPNPPTPSYNLENDVDYVGNDIGSALSTDPAQCCTICKATQGCKAFSWSGFQGGTCWLKNSKTATKSSPGVKSGVI
ncbi:hypothetical protein Poli38472_008045 [Pythium oligandrum]|uniref:Apple domain-containing protein n=1 Tax=Pythium oligandrum TaxID=41045 RepID=A0A8K1CM20_PYTOL|nr:hypothetical protein Poli38472_008045 [Pythium oligandrum]|eukprot:TMW65403.1 hypothetical protein Poli38472_008045 [Pythium oligandrum]